MVRAKPLVTLAPVPWNGLVLWISDIYASNIYALSRVLADLRKLDERFGGVMDAAMLGVTILVEFDTHHFGALDAAKRVLHIGSVAARALPYLSKPPRVAVMLEPAPVNVGEYVMVLQHVADHIVADASHVRLVPNAVALFNAGFDKVVPGRFGAAVVQSSLDLSEVTRFVGRLAKISGCRDVAVWVHRSDFASEAVESVGGVLASQVVIKVFSTGLFEVDRVGV